MKNNALFIICFLNRRFTKAKKSLMTKLHRTLLLRSLEMNPVAFKTSTVVGALLNHRLGEALLLRSPTVLNWCFIYRVRHTKCYKAIALKLLIMSKKISDKSFSVWEGRHTGPALIFIGEGAKATSRSTPLF